MPLHLTSTLCSNRLTTCDVLRVCLLVLDLLLRAEPTCGRDLPCLPAVPHSRRIHRPLQLWTLLSGLAVQRQPQLGSRAHTQTHRCLILFQRDHISSDLICLFIFTLAHNQQVSCELSENFSSLFLFQDGVWGCITLGERCLQSVSVTVPSLSRVPTATSAMAGILPPSAKYRQVSMRGYRQTRGAIRG